MLEPATLAFEVVWVCQLGTSLAQAMPLVFLVPLHDHLKESEAFGRLPAVPLRGKRRWRRWQFVRRAAGAAASRAAQGAS